MGERLDELGRHAARIELDRMFRVWCEAEEPVDSGDDLFKREARQEAWRTTAPMDVTDRLTSSDGCGDEL
jgi:hypothetical protein